MLGHVVEVAHDGPTALANAGAFGAEIALVDLGMPGMDGYELARSLRLGYPDMLLIAVTGYGLERDRQLTAQAGFAHHVVKPVDVDALAALFDAAFPAAAGGADRVGDRFGT
jgi:two-component system CheB/CheR fusion protein